jgi:hypothetical protein
MNKLNACLKVDALALIHAAAEKHKVPAALVRASLQPNQAFEAVSPKGAIGLI